MMDIETILAGKPKFEKYQRPETEIDYRESAWPKRYKEKKKSKGLKRTPLKAHYEPISKELQEAVMANKSDRCFYGLCECCKGKKVFVGSGFDCQPPRGRGGSHKEYDHIHPAHSICNDYYHDHPLDRIELYKKIEAAGHKVIWRIPGKKVNRFANS